MITEELKYKEHVDLTTLAAHQPNILAIDPNYSNRRGYDPSFLGGDSFVPMPTVSTEIAGKLAINSLPLDGTPSYILPYEHFSLALHKERKLALFTAVNINGNELYSISRDDHWVKDPRVDADYQTDEGLYAGNNFDRGHLVRRLDPSWGVKAEAIKANNDTFHFTNCSPQVSGFNQKATYWAGLENYILNNAKTHDLRVCVFTGPVLNATDELYRGIQIPKKFWKVVVITTTAGNFSATGYLVSQAEMLTTMHIPGFIFGKFKTYQVTLELLEDLTGLNFNGLSDFDPLRPSHANVLTKATVQRPMHEVQAFSDVVL